MSDVIDAEIVAVEVDAASERRERRQLNIALGATGGFVVLMMVLASVLPGSAFGNLDDDSSSKHWLPPVWARANLEYGVDDVFSRVSWNGTWEVDAVRSVFVDVPDIVLSDGGAGASGNAQVHLGLWLPVIEGCDWDALASNDTLAADGITLCSVPVIAEVGPYYGDGDVDALTPANRLGRFLIENFVPHGYGVAQVSVFGTGEANHCMDLMGLDEQLGIHAAVEWLGKAAWSNGRVGVIGKSYDGSTPWEAAAMGSEHLATIVPMSGLIGVHDLMWRNGSMEARGAIMHNGVYGSFGMDGDDGDWQNVCEGYLEGYYAGPAAYLTGDDLSWTGSDYWEERHFFTRALENYDGSVYIIHGMQDWNVDPHMAFPTHNILLENGFDVKGLYGQWGHDYPDRNSSHDGGPLYPFTMRWDWADDLLEWFDYYLRDLGPPPLLHAEIQDNRGGWRTESAYPPVDIEWVELGLDQFNLLSGNTLVTPTSQLEIESEQLENDLRIVGNPTLHIQATISLWATSGHLFAELTLGSTGEHLGHAVMDLRFADGGKQGRTLAPGETVTAMMEFFGMDVLVPAGDTLVLRISQTGRDYTPSVVSIQPVTVSLTADSVLGLSVVNRTCADLFMPPMMPDEYPQCADGE